MDSDVQSHIVALSCHSYLDTSSRFNVPNELSPGQFNRCCERLRSETGIIQTDHQLPKNASRSA